MKKLLQINLILLLLFFAFNLSACSNSNDLYILNWDEYIDEDLIEAFEQQYNCNVILDTAQSNETMFTKIMSDAAPYDIAFPSDYMIAQMIECDEDGVVAPIIKKIDYSKLTNYSADMFDEKLRFLTERDCKNLTGYYVPYFWGSLGIMYNTDNLSEEQVETIKTHGWSVLFEKELLGDAKIAMYASARDSIASALLYKGYSLNTKNPNELEEAAKALENMNYVAWATDELKTGVASGKYDVALVYSGDYFDTLYSVYEESDDPHISFDMYAPKDRNNVFFDAMVIPNNSMNEELAYKFIDFMLEFENAYQNASYVGYCPTDASVFNAMYNDPEFEGITDLEVYYPGNIDVLGGEIYQYLGTKTYELYDLIYKRVKK